jgi:hypothetical protein
MAPRESLYDQMVAITTEYLGPAADRFLYRQVVNHLGITPNNLNKSDARKLVTWIRLAMTILTNDEEMVEEYISEIERLLSNGKKKPAHS